MAGGNLLVPKIEKWAEKRRKSGGSSMAPEQLLSANDDQVEKENARQNATPQGGIGMTPFKSMKGDAKKRQSFDARGGEMSMTPQGGRLDGERLKSLYGDCIKLANENKITQKNAWTMNLLDHIRGLTGNGGETDFVTAGCTLDAAGKIYSCRVDSVHNETFRVCTGLSRSAPLPNLTPASNARGLSRRNGRIGLRLELQLR
ncbi:condensin complex subunit 2-domain-containing protein, partial [Baffinella frigidus]